MFMKKLLTIVFIAIVSLRSHSQVVINEVHPKPSGGDTDQAFQSMYNSTPTSGAEFVELYNTSPCDPVDISCWSLGGMDGATNGGAFSFPAGTVIPPLGFITIGGPVTTGVTFNLNLAANASRLWRSNASRWHLPNGDGWLGLYDASGAPVDGVYWTFASNDPGKLNTDDTYTGAALQRLGACGGGGLATASAIPGIEYMVSATATGQSFERTTDGGTVWVLGAPTPNNCNGTCVIANTFQLNATVQQPQCGQPNGSISFSPLPSDTYFYNWPFPTTGTMSSATNLSAGSYDITITNASGCSKDTTITLVSSGGITAVNVTTSDPDCGQSNGSVTIGTVTGGTAPYQYSFNGSALSGNTLYSALAAGSYTLSVTDNAGCSYTAPNVILTSASGPTAINVSSTDAGCTVSDGSVTLGSVTGGTAPYEYSFNGSAYTTTTSYTGLAAGTYTLSVRDAGGCVYNAATIQIGNGNGPTAVQVSITPEYCGQNNGTATITGVTGGTSPYTYDFNNTGSNTLTSFTALSNGTYTLSVQDAAGCLYNAASIVINEVAGPTSANVTLVNATCGANNGSVTIQGATGGTAPYTYNFNNLGSGTETSFTGLAGGSYGLVVTDAHGCSLTAGPYVISNSSGPNSVTANVTNASCQGNNGSITLSNVQGGTGPYQYSLNGSAFSSTLTFSNLSPGAFTITVQDANGCTYTAPSVNVGGISGPTALPVSVTDALCDDDNGQISVVSVTGGTAPYTFSINGSAFGNQQDFGGLSPGTYTIATQDAQGCLFQVQVAVEGGSSPEADFNINPAAVSTFDPYAQLINLSSEDANSFSWIITSGTPAVSSLENPNVSYENIEPGTYPITLIVQNSDGCTDTITKSIEVYDEFIVFAPNAFTPDGDEFNNSWNVIVNNADLESYNLEIFNRWGELLFNSNDPDEGWDGTKEGTMVQDGVYTWKLRIKDVRTDKIYSFVGHITKTQ